MKNSRVLTDRDKDLSALCRWFPYRSSYRQTAPGWSTPEGRRCWFQRCPCKLCHSPVKTRTQSLTSSGQSERRNDGTMSSSAWFRQQVAPHPSHLIHSDDWRDRQRLQKLQNHFERFLSFGLQHHHYRLQGGGRRYSDWTSSILDNQRPQSTKQPAVLICVLLGEVYLVDELVVEMRNLQISQASLGLLAVPWQDVLL